MRVIDAGEITKAVRLLCIAAKEDELLHAVNALGIGPMGLGGKTTCLAVKIALSPCHIGSLPLAVNFQCHSSRHKTAVL